MADLGCGGWRACCRAGAMASVIQGRCCGEASTPPPKLLGRSLTLIAKEKLISPALANSQISSLTRSNSIACVRALARSDVSASCYYYYQD